MKERKWLRFPFTAIINLFEVKTALLANLVNPKIGGLLIRGPKGSGKSTVVRSLEDILPRMKTVKGCRFNCNPDSGILCNECREKLERGELEIVERQMKIITLPLSATEDRVIGSLSIEEAVKKGVESFKPGILAEANQNILYIDEVNLLPDYLVDDLLDVAVSGVNIVEREGVSFEHPSNFILIGTMNPEEGELRPQLLDRFPLSVTVKTNYSLEDRVKIVKRNSEFKNNPISFYKKFEKRQEEVRERIIEARKILKDVYFPEELLKLTAELCNALKVDGVRPDIIIYETAVAIAALDLRKKVSFEDVKIAAKLALTHRTRKGGFLEPATEDEIEKTFNFLQEPKQVSVAGRKGRKKGEVGKGESGKKGRFHPVVKIFILAASTSLFFMSLFYFTSLPFLKKLVEVVSPFSLLLVTICILYLVSKARHGSLLAVKTFLKDFLRGYRLMASDFFVPTTPEKEITDPLIYKAERNSFSKFVAFKLEKGNKRKNRGGRRIPFIASKDKGKIRGWKEPKGKPRSIYLPATLREASKHQKRRKGELAVKVYASDIKEKIYENKASSLILLVLDLSDSMNLIRTKITEALKSLYVNFRMYRDKVGVVGVRGKKSFLVQSPTRNMNLLKSKLEKLETGGLTPLASGLLQALKLIKTEKIKDKEAFPALIVFSDGFANMPLPEDVLTHKERKLKITTTEKQRAKAVEDLVYVSKLINQEKVKTFIINPDFSAYSYQISPNEAGNLYKEVLKQEGVFRGETFLKEVKRKYDPPTLGSFLTSLIAFLTEGSCLLAVNEKTAAKAINMVFEEAKNFSKSYSS